MYERVSSDCVDLWVRHNPWVVKIGLVAYICGSIFQTDYVHIIFSRAFAELIFE